MTSILMPPPKVPLKEQIRLWWTSVDRLMLFFFALLIGIGIWLIQAASPAVAVRVHLAKFYFVERHILLLPLTIALIVGLSTLTPRRVRITALVALPIFAGLTFLTLFFGMETKGATRWLALPGFSLQPSEFLKPLYAIVGAWLFSKGHEYDYFPGGVLGTATYVVCAALLVAQPDIGMTVVLTSIWAVMVFIGGLPWIWIGMMLGGGMGAFGLAYIFLHHVQSRVNRFLNPEAGDTFQIQRSMDAFREGGWFGLGPGEGSVKSVLPDAHADFIFSVGGEELGIVFCMLLVMIFLGLVLRALWQGRRTHDVFTQMAVGGLSTQIAMQALINTGSALHLIPTKGMTLPFISYGGSSLLSLGCTAGFLLALTRGKPADAPASLTPVSLPETEIDHDR